MASSEAEQQQYLASCSMEELLLHVKSEPESSSSSGSSSEDSDDSDIEGNTRDQTNDSQPGLSSVLDHLNLGASQANEHGIVDDPLLDMLNVVFKDEPSSDIAFRCKVCGYKTKKLATLRKHEAAHEKNSRFSCNYCSFTHRQAEKVRIHEAKHTGVKPHKCTLCPKAFHCKGDLSKHQRVHSSERKFKCHLCPYTSKWKPAMTKHILYVHTYDRPYPCPLCDMTFKRPSAVKAHMKSHSDQKPHFCEVCGFRAKTKFEVDSHKARHFDVRMFPCPFPGCTQKCKRRGDLTKHLKTHESSLKYQCDLCQKRFKTKMSIRRHLITHLERGQRHECSLCNKVLYSYSGFRTHMYHHRSKRRFMCNICGHLTRTGSNMRTHMEVHSTDRDLICPICGHRSYPGKPFLIHLGHEHLKEYSYFCELCRKPYGAFSAVRLHIERCHQDKTDGKELKFVYEPSSSLNRTNEASASKGTKGELEYQPLCSSKTPPCDRKCNSKEANDSSNSDHLGKEQNCVVSNQTSGAVTDMSSSGEKTSVADLCTDTAVSGRDPSSVDVKTFSSLTDSSVNNPLTMISAVSSGGGSDSVNTDRTSVGEMENSAEPPLKPKILPDWVKIGNYGGVGVCMAHKNSKIVFNFEKNGKKPRLWFMEPERMPKEAAKKMKRYMDRIHVSSVYEIPTGSGRGRGRGGMRFRGKHNPHTAGKSERRTQATVRTSQDSAVRGGLSRRSRGRQARGRGKRRQTDEEETSDCSSGQDEASSSHSSPRQDEGITSPQKLEKKALKSKVIRRSGRKVVKRIELKECSSSEFDIEIDCDVEEHVLSQNVDDDNSLRMQEECHEGGDRVDDVPDTREGTGPQLEPAGPGEAVTGDGRDLVGPSQPEDHCQLIFVPQIAHGDDSQPENQGHRLNGYDHRSKSGLSELGVQGEKIIHDTADYSEFRLKPLNVSLCNRHPCVYTGGSGVNKPKDVRREVQSVESKFKQKKCGGRPKLSHIVIDGSKSVKVRSSLSVTPALPKHVVTLEEYEQSQKNKKKVVVKLDGQGNHSGHVHDGTLSDTNVVHADKPDVITSSDEDNDSGQCDDSAPIPNVEHQNTPKVRLLSARVSTNAPPCTKQQIKSSSQSQTTNMVVSKVDCGSTASPPSQRSGLFLPNVKLEDICDPKISTSQSPARCVGNKSAGESSQVNNTLDREILLNFLTTRGYSLTEDGCIVRGDYPSTVVVDNSEGSKSYKANTDVHLHDKQETKDSEKLHTPVDLQNPLGTGNVQVCEDGLDTQVSKANSVFGHSEEDMDVIGAERGKGIEGLETKMDVQNSKSVEVILDLNRDSNTQDSKSVEVILDLNRDSNTQDPKKAVDPQSSGKILDQESSWCSQESIQDLKISVQSEKVHIAVSHSIPEDHAVNNSLVPPGLSVQCASTYPTPCDVSESSVKSLGQNVSQVQEYFTQDHTSSIGHTEQHPSFTTAECCLDQPSVSLCQTITGHSASCSSTDNIFMVPTSEEFKMIKPLLSKQDVTVDKANAGQDELMSCDHTEPHTEKHVKAASSDSCQTGTSVCDVLSDGQAGAGHPLATTSDQCDAPSTHSSHCYPPDLLPQQTVSAGQLSQSVISTSSDDATEPSEKCELSKSVAPFHVPYSDELKQVSGVSVTNFEYCDSSPHSIREPVTTSCVSEARNNPDNCMPKPDTIPSSDYDKCSPKPLEPDVPSNEYDNSLLKLDVSNKDYDNCVPKPVVPSHEHDNCGSNRVTQHDEHKDVSEKHGTSEPSISRIDVFEDCSAMKCPPIPSREEGNITGKDSDYRNTTIAEEDVAVSKCTRTSISGDSPQAPQSRHVFNIEYTSLVRGLSEVGYCLMEDGTIMKIRDRTKRNSISSGQSSEDESSRCSELEDVKSHLGSPTLPGDSSHRETERNMSRRMRKIVSSSLPSGYYVMKNGLVGKIPKGYILRKNGRLMKKPGPKLKSPESHGHFCSAREEETQSTPEEQELVSKSIIPEGYILNRKGRLMKKPGPKPKSPVSSRDVGGSESEYAGNELVSNHSVILPKAFNRKKNGSFKKHKQKSPHVYASESEQEYSQDVSQVAMQKAKETTPEGDIVRKNGRVMKKPGPKSKTLIASVRTTALKKKTVQHSLGKPEPGLKMLTLTESAISAEVVAHTGTSQCTQLLSEKGIPEGYIMTKTGRLMKKPGPKSKMLTTGKTSNALVKTMLCEGQSDTGAIPERVCSQGTIDDEKTNRFGTSSGFSKSSGAQKVDNKQVKPSVTSETVSKADILVCSKSSTTQGAQLTSLQPSVTSETIPQVEVLKMQASSAQGHNVWSGHSHSNSSTSGIVVPDGYILKKNGRLMRKPGPKSKLTASGSDNQCTKAPLKSPSGEVGSTVHKGHNTTKQGCVIGKPTGTKIVPQVDTSVQGQKADSQCGNRKRKLQASPGKDVPSLKGKKAQHHTFNKSAHFDEQESMEITSTSGSPLIQNRVFESSQLESEVSSSQEAMSEKGETAVSTIKHKSVKTKKVRKLGSMSDRMVAEACASKKARQITKKPARKSEHTPHHSDAVTPFDAHSTVESTSTDQNLVLPRLQMSSTAELGSGKSKKQKLATSTSPGSSPKKKKSLMSVLISKIPEGYIINKHGHLVRKPGRKASKDVISPQSEKAKVCKQNQKSEVKLTKKKGKQRTNVGVDQWQKQDLERNEQKDADKIKGFPRSPNLTRDGHVTKKAGPKAKFSAEGPKQRYRSKQGKKQVAKGLRLADSFFKKKANKSLSTSQLPNKTKSGKFQSGSKKSSTDSVWKKNVNNSKTSRVSESIGSIAVPGGSINTEDEKLTLKHRAKSKNDNSSKNVKNAGGFTGGKTTEVEKGCNLFLQKCGPKKITEDSRITATNSSSSQPSKQHQKGSLSVAHTKPPNKLVPHGYIINKHGHLRRKPGRKPRPVEVVPEEMDKAAHTGAVSSNGDGSRTKLVDQNQGRKVDPAHLAHTGLESVEKNLSSWDGSDPQKLQTDESEPELSPSAPDVYLDLSQEDVDIIDNNTQDYQSLSPHQPPGILSASMAGNDQMVSDSKVASTWEITSASTGENYQESLDSYGSQLLSYPAVVEGQGMVVGSLASVSDSGQSIVPVETGLVQSGMTPVSFADCSLYQHAEQDAPEMSDKPVLLVCHAWNTSDPPTIPKSEPEEAVVKEDVFSLSLTDPEQQVDIKDVETSFSSHNI